MIRRITRRRAIAAAAEKSINAYYTYKGQPVLVSVYRSAGFYKVHATVGRPDGTWMTWRAWYGGTAVHTTDITAAVIKEINDLMTADQGARV